MFTKWILNNAQYITITGSHAYGVAEPESDLDCYGFVIPPKDYFPKEFIPGFDEVREFSFTKNRSFKFEGKDIDLTLYNIARYFKLCADGNPNLIDTLFTTEHLVKTEIAEHFISNRKLFLSKQVFYKFRGYALSQLKKIKEKEYKNSPKRLARKEAHGYDTKAGYHIVRLMDECEQLLETGTLDLTRAKNLMKQVRSGQVSYDELINWYTEKEKVLTQVHVKSELPDKPDMGRVRKVLLECLEMFYEAK